MELLEQVALVTGSSRGVGRGIALMLAEKGADVVVNYRSAAEKAMEVVAEIEQIGRQAITVQADVSDEDEVQRLFETIDAEFGKLDILVNNAGTAQPKDIFEETLDDWEHILRTNLTSSFLCSKAAMQRMKKAHHGRIINISSMTAQRGALYGHAHYAASKSGQIGLAKTLARTGAPLGITVNCVIPGIIATELLGQTHSQDEIDELSASIPLGLGTCRDVGLAVAFLCGEGGRYITGATIDVNGGMYIR